MKTCADVMTRDPLYCLPSDTVDKVAQLMERANIGAVPVLASHETKHLVGIVTDRDLALNVVAQGGDNRQVRVEAVLTPNPWVCHPGDSIEDAADIMAQEQIRRLPVVDDEGRIVGIIAQADIATRTNDYQQTAEVVEQISQPSNGSQLL